MIWLFSVLCSLTVMGISGIVPPEGTLLASDEPPGFFLLWTRYSAHLAFLFLLVAFLTSTARRRWRHPVTRVLMDYRRQLGLGFATAHAFHLAALTLLLLDLEGFSVTASLAVAAFGYVVTTALAVTSNNWSVRRLGVKRWRLLHTTGINILMLYFFVAFSAALIQKGGTVYVVYVLAIIGAVVAKASARKTRLQHTTD
jgi:DMSO/TMAO reductase YedYZ heme-binding membrane subunit